MVDKVMRLDIVETGRRRRFSDAEKVRIVEESFSGWRQATATARRYGICTSLLYRWRALWREGRLGNASSSGDSAPAFVPAVIVSDDAETKPGDEPASAPSAVDTATEPAPPHDRIEIIAPGGYRILVGADIDGDALRRVLAVVEAR
jgi:transposase